VASYVDAWLILGSRRAQRPEHSGGIAAKLPCDLSRRHAFGAFLLDDCRIEALEHAFRLSQDDAFPL
jgi:hypothetical protein